MIFNMSVNLSFVLRELTVWKKLNRRQRVFAVAERFWRRQAAGSVACSCQCTERCGQRTPTDWRTLQERICGGNEESRTEAQDRDLGHQEETVGRCSGDCDCIYNCTNILSSRSDIRDFPFGALTLLVERQEVHQARKKLDVGLLVVTGWLKPCTSYSSSCHHLLHHP